MRKLSQRQETILAFINEYMDDHGYPPSIREIGAAAGISSTSVVDYNLKALERNLCMAVISALPEGLIEILPYFKHYDICRDYLVNTRRHS